MLLDRIDLCWAIQTRHVPAIFLTLLFYKNGSICKQNLNLILDPDWTGDKPIWSLREVSAAAGTTATGWSPNGNPCYSSMLALCCLKTTSGDPDELLYRFQKHVRKDSCITSTCFYSNPGATTHCRCCSQCLPFKPNTTGLFQRSI